MDLDHDKLAELAMAMLALTTFEEGPAHRAWKGLDWAVMDDLFERGWICDPKGKARSVVLTEEGRERSLEFKAKHLASERGSADGAEPLGAKIQAANDVLFAPGNLDRVGEFFSPDYVVHVTGKDIKGGPEFVAKFIGMVQRAFPDLQTEVEVLVEAGDRVAWQRTVRGTHEGAFKGFPATGRELTWRDVVTSRFEDGLIVEDWSITDLAESLLLAKKRAR